MSDQLAISAQCFVLQLLRIYIASTKACTIIHPLFPRGKSARFVQLETSSSRDGRLNDRELHQRERQPSPLPYRYIIVDVIIHFSEDFLRRLPIDEQYREKERKKERERRRELHAVTRVRAGRGWNHLWQWRGYDTRELLAQRLVDKFMAAHKTHRQWMNYCAS